MAARFRIVHFVQDPFLGWRTPIAALLDHGGPVAVVRVKCIPCAECLGGPEAAATLRMILEDLADVRSFDRLPASMGPRAILDQPRRLPDVVSDPVGWVERLLNPR